MSRRSSANDLITIWIGADQCSPTNSALMDVGPSTSVVLMIESMTQAGRTAFHKRRLVFAFSVMRHFATDLRAAGWTVEYYSDDDDIDAALKRHAARFGAHALRMMDQSEYGVSEVMTTAAQRAGFTVERTPHTNFLSTASDFDALVKTRAARVTMDVFYRAMRRKTGLLMDGREPTGGAWNYDAANREPPRLGLQFAPAPRFEPDATTLEAIALVERRFAHHPGVVGDFALAVTRRDALRALEHFCETRLDTFGPWQDAMLSGDTTMSHSLLGGYVNAGLLHPLEMCERAERAYRDGSARLSSVEGFVRQLLGWREYVWRVYWKLMPEYRTRNALGAKLRLPRFYWTGETRMACLREALETVRTNAYAHHIVRLMVLGNFALIAGCDPVETNDWFWSMFIDAYDWVMVPNVIGMTLHADGGYVGTKPYCASANYINKMSNYCKPCVYERKAVITDDACPFNALYWDFIARNMNRFRHNPRMALIVRGWQKRPAAERNAIQGKAARTRAALCANEPI